MANNSRTYVAKVSLALIGLLSLIAGPAAAAHAAEPPQIDQSRIDELATTVAAERGTFGGVSIDEAAGTLTVRYTVGAGPQTAQGRLSKFTGAHQQGAKRIKLVLVPVRHSLSELDTVRDRMAADQRWTSVSSNVVSQTYVDVAHNLVAVGVTKITPEVTEVARAEFGDLVSLHVAARPDRTSRTDDFEPWTVGIRIWSATAGCTTGFVIHSTTTTAKRMVTAGHCGAVGTAWNNNGDPVGSTVVRNFTDGGFDVSYIGGRTYEPWSYVGGPTSDVGQAITGTYLSLVGRKFCTNGATSGEVCSGTVTAIDACITFSDGIRTCFLDVLTADGSFTLTRPGDSGGPVINIPSVSPGSILIGGIIIGGGNPTYFHSYHYLIPSGWAFDHA
jgi:hypothetical protein